MTTDPPSDDDLAALLDSERGHQAARDRSTRRWLRQQALEEAKLTGVLLSAAEQDLSVTIRTSAGRSYTGPVTSVGSDFCGVRSGDLDVYIRLDAVTVVQPDRNLQALPAGDDRRGPVTMTLHEFLAGHAPERPDVSVVCTGQTQAVPGRLLAVGADVVSLEVDDKRTIAYVALASVTELSLRASG